jgi:acyl dehydratase
VRDPVDNGAVADEGGVGHSRSQESSIDEWVADHASHESVWSLLSFFELPVNAAEEILAQSGLFPPEVDEESDHSLPGRAMPAPLDSSSDAAIKDAAEKVSVCVRHARAYMGAAASSPLTAKPTFLYYGCLALARAVVASVFVREQFTTAHGIKFDRGTRVIKVARRGEVADLHDATFTLPDFYDNKTYELDKVVRILPGANAAMKRVTGRDEYVHVDPGRCPRRSYRGNGRHRASYRVGDDRCVRLERLLAIRPAGLGEDPPGRARWPGPRAHGFHGGG